MLSRGSLGWGRWSLVLKCFRRNSVRWRLEGVYSLFEAVPGPLFFPLFVYAFFADRLAQRTKNIIEHGAVLKKKKEY